MKKTPVYNLKPRKEYFRTPILETLKERGGRARRHDVLNAPLVQAAAAKMREDYRQNIWKEYCDNMRAKLVGEGSLRDKSPRGVWELS
ncbi:hypothetical protein C6495_17420 [Candidatus Poribacteria bacterium]|nr:MAG: hypothetical protein C6495_17420 [Candidatus Poribacteria bacterium]